MCEPEATPDLPSRSEHVRRRTRDDVGPHLSHAAPNSLRLSRLLSLLGWSSEQEPELQGRRGEQTALPLSFSFQPRKLWLEYFL